LTRRRSDSSAAVIGHVVKGFPDDSSDDRTRLLAVGAGDDEARIMVFHRRSPISLGSSHFADVLAALPPARWYARRTRKRFLLELLRRD